MFRVGRQTMRGLCVWMIAGMISQTIPCSAITLTTVNLESRPDARRIALQSRADLSVLSDRDLILFVDKSQSMSRKDCPNQESTASTEQISRWQWCQEQMHDLAQRTNGLLKSGIRVVFFNDETEIYDDVDAPGVNMLFTEKSPAGATYASLPLKNQLDRYFSKREKANSTGRRLLIGVISDGCPNDPQHLCERIAAATQHMSQPDEIAITFIQIGDDERANKILSELDSGLIAHNKAKYDIVCVKKFPDVTRCGLAQTLADSITEKPARSAMAAEESFYPHQ